MEGSRIYVLDLGRHGNHGHRPPRAQDPRMIALWVVCFAISIAGILLLRRALRR